MFLRLFMSLFNLNVEIMFLRLLMSFFNLNVEIMFLRLLMSFFNCFKSNFLFGKESLCHKLKVFQSDSLNHDISNLNYLICQNS